MISDKIPQNEIVEQIPKEPFNWIPLIYIGLAALAIIILGVLIFVIKRHYKKKYYKYNETKELRKNPNNSQYFKVICMEFKQFHDYYSLNPERYKLEYAQVMVYSDAKLKGEEVSWNREYSYCIIFKFKDYKRYREWIEKSTNGMVDPKAVTDTLGFLKVVESDIQAIREREAVSVNEAQKTMQEVMGRLKEEFLDLEKDTSD